MVFKLIEEIKWLGCVAHKAVIIIDNAAIHNDFKRVLEKEWPGAQLLRFGPYSAPLNPIENIWSILKSDIKQNLADTIEFDS